MVTDLQLRIKEILETSRTAYAEYHIKKWTCEESAALKFEIGSIICKANLSDDNQIFSKMDLIRLHFEFNGQGHFLYLSYLEEIAKHLSSISRLGKNKCELSEYSLIQLCDLFDDLILSSQIFQKAAKTQIDSTLDFAMEVRYEIRNRNQLESEIKKDEIETKQTLMRKRRSQFGNKRNELMLALIDRDGHKCNECDSLDELCVDHITPLSKGGGDELENLQILCCMCNARKGAR